MGAQKRRMGDHSSVPPVRKIKRNRVAADDNPMKLMSIALKPLTSPPFPLERIEELTALMGGDGKME